MVKIGLIGCGIVGQGVLKVMEKHQASIERRVGAPVRIIKICDLNPRIADKVPARYRDIFCKDPDEILQDPEIDLVVELVGGVDFARKIILQAFQQGKHVVTANKALLSQYWDEIFVQARKYGVLIYFEASVGGGIPVIQSLNEGLAANKIESILGILNGTTNFILTKMSEEKMDFDKALRQAQKLGFAERNPSLDIKGIDSKHKISILASIAFGSWIKPEDIYCQGIEKISLQDVVFADEEFGYALKLLAIAKDDHGAIQIRVHPTLISKEHLLTSVDNQYNAIYISGDASGDTMYYGQGAGQLPAASAVVSDIIDLSRNIFYKTAGTMPYVHYDPDKKLKIRNISELGTKYYMRFTTKDKPGVLSKISGILGKNKVSIESCFQKGYGRRNRVPIIMITHKALEKNVMKALAEINRLPVVQSDTVYIRIEE